MEQAKIDLINERIKKNPYEFICNYAEKLLPFTGREIFKTLSLLPVSLVCPKITYLSKEVRSTMNVLFLSPPGGGKSTISSLFTLFTKNPLEYRSITSADLENQIYANTNEYGKIEASLILEDYNTMAKDEVILKIVEGILGEEQCIFEESLVLMGDGSLKKIKDVGVGETVISFNEILDFERSKIKNKIKKEFDSYLEIKTRTSSILVSHNHKFFILNGDKFNDVEAKNLKVGDFVPMPLKLSEDNIKSVNLPLVKNYADKVYITPEGRKFLRETMKKLKLDKYEVDRRLKKSLGYMSHITNYKLYARKKKDDVEKIFNVLSLDKKILENISLFNLLTNPVSIPKQTNKEFCEFLGAYWGDGNYCENTMTLYMSDKDKNNLEVYSEKIRKVFNVKTRIADRGNKHQLYIKKAVPLFELLQKLGLKRSKERILPSLLYLLNNEELSAFIRGYFDAESSVRLSPTGGTICVESSCKDAMCQLRVLLLRFGILGSLKEREKYDERRKNDKKYNCYSVLISDRDSMKKFKEHIGYNHPEKKKKLDYAVSKSKDGHRKYFRYKPELINDIVRLLGITLDSVFQETNVRMNEFKSLEFNIPLKTMKKLVSHLNKQFEKVSNPSQELKSKIEFMNLLLRKSNELVFDEIIGINEIDGKKTFYDISLDKNYNFVANGLFTHNCLDRHTTKKQMREKVNIIGLLCGVPQDLREKLTSGTIFRTLPILSFHSNEEHEEIGKGISQGIFCDKSVTEDSKLEEDAIVSHYKSVFARRNEISGFIVEQHYKDKLTAVWNTTIQAFRKKSKDNYFRELFDGYRILQAHAMLNIHNRKIVDKRLIVEESDLDVAIDIMRKAIITKYEVLTAERIYERIRGSSTEYMNFMQSKHSEKIKNLVDIYFGTT